MKTIQLKAFVLLIVFSLNTIVGFACAVGLNMGFNETHHHGGSASHAIKSHHHHEKPHHHHHEKSHQHHHDKPHQHHHGSHVHTSGSHAGDEINKSGAPEKENCCNDDATRLSQSDKLLVNAINSGIEMPVTLIALHFLYISHLSFFKPQIKKLQEVRPYVLNARGIRVSIQSFQI